MNKKARVYEDLKARIISLELAPGTPVNEAEIAEMLGVSKTPLREALMQLERDGLVDSVPARGSSISQITAREVEDVLQIRELVESGIAKRVAAVGGTPALLRERDTMAKLLREGKTLSEYVYEWGSCEDMHRVVVEALGNALLVHIYGGLIDRIARIRNYYGERFTRRRRHDIVAEHAAILDAIVTGDAAGAEMLMANHLQNARAFLGGLSDQENGVKQWST